MGRKARSDTKTKISLKGKSNGKMSLTLRPNQSLQNEPNIQLTTKKLTEMKENSSQNERNNTEELRRNFRRSISLEDIDRSCFKKKDNNKKNDSVVSSQSGSSSTSYNRLPNNDLVALSTIYSFSSKKNNKSKEKPSYSDSGHFSALFNVSFFTFFLILLFVIYFNFFNNFILIYFNKYYYFNLFFILFSFNFF